ncbi:hypothetical protein GCM10009626_06260 [Brachybacterium sacelli]
MALLGLLGGLLVGIVLQDVLAPLLVRGGEVSALGLAVLPLLLPLSALVGAALAVVPSLRRARRRRSSPPGASD